MLEMLCTLASPDMEIYLLIYVLGFLILAHQAVRGEEERHEIA